MNLISIHHDRQTRRAYWIEINQRECPPVPRFMSAPLFGNGRVDYSNKSPIGDMETMEPFNCFSESPRPIAEDYKNFQNLIRIFENLWKWQLEDLKLEEVKNGYD